MGSVVCPACRIENSDAVMFCRQCGGRLAGLASPQFAPQIVPSAPAWGCATCRKENQPHYKFCLGCGAARDAAPTAFRPEYERAPSRGAPVVLIVAIVVVVLSAGAAVALVLLR